MFRKVLSTYPKCTVHSPQYKVWMSLEKDKIPVWGEVTKNDTGLDTTEYGFKREIVPSDFKYEKPKEKPKEKPEEKIWHGWIP